MSSRWRAGRVSAKWSSVTMGQKTEVRVREREVMISHSGALRAFLANLLHLEVQRRHPGRAPSEIGTCSLRPPGRPWFVRAVSAKLLQHQAVKVDSNEHLYLLALKCIFSI